MANFCFTVSDYFYILDFLHFIKWNIFENMKSG